MFATLRVAPSDQPLSPDLHGYREEVAAVAAVGSNNNGNNTSPMQALLAYVVVMLTAFVLHRFADSRTDVRLLASRVFTKLLILLPLEVRLNNLCLSYALLRPVANIPIRFFSGVRYRHP